MNIKPLSVPRSDLAIELAQSLLKQEKTLVKNPQNPLYQKALSVHTQNMAQLRLPVLESPPRSCKAAKPQGKYITIQTPLWNSLLNPSGRNYRGCRSYSGSCCPPMEVYWLPDLATIRSTPDALGPAVIKPILLPAIFKGELAKQTGLDTLRKTSAIAR